MIIWISDCKKVFYCSRGIRLFAVKYDMDYADFIKNGIDSEKLLRLTSNDSMAVKIVEHAHGRV